MPSRGKNERNMKKDDKGMNIAKGWNKGGMIKKAALKMAALDFD